MSPGALEAVVTASKEPLELEACNTIDARMEDEAKGLTPGDLPSWVDAASDPFLMLLQLLMLLENPLSECDFQVNHLWAFNVTLFTFSHGAEFWAIRSLL